LVDFQFHNLASLTFPAAPGGSTWDAIFCRNVLIYFSRETVREIISHFYERLSPNGYLFLGSSESLLDLAEGFDVLNEEKAFVYRKTGNLLQTKTPVIAVQKPKTVQGKLTPSSAPASAPIASSLDLKPSLQDTMRKLKQGNTDDAFKILFSLTRSHPEAIEPYLLLGQVAIERGALEEAWSWYLAASEIQPLSIEARFFLAVTLHQLGHNREAAEELRRVLFLDKTFFLGYYYLGVISQCLGDLETALRSFRNAIRTCELASDAKDCQDLIMKAGVSRDTVSAASAAALRQMGQDDDSNGTDNR
jgi:chemotaxis protein methyltransferase CheR